MIKILCSPFVKIALFLLGYVGAVSMARAISHTFDVVLGSTFGNQLRFGLPLGTALFTGSAVLFLLAVWKTEPREHREVVHRLWRSLDGALLVLLAGYTAFWLLSTAHTDWAELGVFILPLLAYAVVILAFAELVARLRDKDLLRTLYWVRFFRAHPIWRPLGFLFVLLLIGNLLLLLIFTPDIAVRLGYYPHFGITLFQPLPGNRWFVELTEIYRVFAALILIALTYFAAVLLNLEARYDQANAEKIRAERFKSELITNVSHDIRTPLTSIINYVDLLNKLPLEGKTAEYAAVLDQKSDRLKMLIDDLLEASKAGTGNIKMTVQTVNLNEIVGQAAGEFEEQFRERNLTLVFYQPEKPIFVDTDNRHLWRVLENLFSNAAKYALPGTRVFAEMSINADGRPIFALKNTSEAPLDLSGEALTEQFIRSDRARQSEGSGLGLYIAKNLTELLGGRFAIRTRGDLFEVEIVF